MNIYQLATVAGQQIKALDYEEIIHDNIMKCRSAADIVNLWLNFLIDNRDSEGFRLRVNNADNLPALLSWCQEARDLLTVE